MLKRIDVPIDLTDRSMEGAYYAASLADHFNAELRLLHVVDNAHFDFAMIEPSAELFQQAGEVRRRHRQSLLDEGAAAIRSRARVSTEVLEGDPADQILCASRRGEADLIVMPTRGRSRLRQFLIGSVTAKVLHDAAVPVWTGVHLNHRANFPLFGLTNILCAVDLGPQTGAALRYAAQLSTEFGARLTVMHVVQEVSTEPRSRIESLLAEAVTQATIRLELGEPARMITNAAAQVHADLLVIGRACTTGLMGRLREQAYAIVRDSPCPVLSV